MIRSAGAAALAGCMLTSAVAANAGAQDGGDSADLRRDAEALLDLIDENYAYLHRFGGVNPARQAEGVDADVSDRAALLFFGECALNALQDHHASMGVSSASSYGLTPTYNDLWVEYRGGDYVVTDVRANSPAQDAGIAPGWTISRIGNAAAGDAVSALRGGPYETDSARGFAARTLVAGRRDRDRDIVFIDGDGAEQRRVLPNLYAVEQTDRPAIMATRRDGVLVLRFNDSLGRPGLIDDIDAALSGPTPRAVIIDLRDTPSGGNTTNARALMSRFVSEVRGYQRHALPNEQRDEGVARQWVEEVVPRGESLAGIPVIVLAGRWTGSMGEGLTLGFDAAVDATVMAAPMAGLLGGIYNYSLPETGWRVSFPAETLFHIDGTPREDFRGDVVLESADLIGPGGEDLALERAFELLGD